MSFILTLCKTQSDTLKNGVNNFIRILWEQLYEGPITISDFRMQSPGGHEDYKKDKMRENS